MSISPPEPSGEGREAAGRNPGGFCFYAPQDHVYIDGFNLYYGCVRRTSHKWLDLAALCARLLPNDHVDCIRYFTALVTPRPDDPQQRNRQETYLRALRTIPNLTIDFGSFLASKQWMMRADRTGMVQVLKSEEKGSDVNLASRLLIDCYRNECDVAVVVSNDSDLVFPIKHVRRSIRKIVGVVSPHRRPSRDLMAVASFFKSIRPSVLAGCQFPDNLKDALGEFHRPQAWR